jgi:hypothetical protein
MELKDIISGKVARVSYVEDWSAGGIRGRRIKLMLEGVYWKAPVMREGKRVQEFFVGFVLDAPSSLELRNADALIGEIVELREAWEEGFAATAESKLAETVDLEAGPWLEEMPWVWSQQSKKGTSDDK